MRHAESGRTLTEVLAVITVMGVITYGALIGISSVIHMWKVSATYTDLDTLATGIVDMYAYWLSDWPPSLSGISADDIRNNAKKNDLEPKDVNNAGCAGIMSHSGCIEIKQTKAPNSRLLLKLTADKDTIERLAHLQYHHLDNCTISADEETLTCTIPDPVMTH